MADRDRNKTFKPKQSGFLRPVKNEEPKYPIETLGSGDVATAVKCPPREDLNEWLAIHGTLSEGR